MMESLFFASVQYYMVADAIDLILAMGNNAQMCKTDVQHAFRIILIEYSDHHLLGFSFTGEIYYDMSEYGLLF